MQSHSTLELSDIKIANLKWKQRFLAHFPHLKDHIVDDEDTNWEVEFKKAYTNEYATLDERSRQLFTAVKDADIENFSKPGIQVNDLFAADKNKINLLTWIKLKKNQEFYNLAYQVILQQFLEADGKTLKPTMKLRNLGILYWALFLNQRLNHLLDLVKNGAELNHKYKTHNQPSYYLIHHAIDMGAIEFTKALLNKHPNLLEQPTDDFETPLLRAVKNGHVGLVTYLLSKDANNKAINLKGSDCVRLAVENADIDVLNVLIKAGAEINQPGGRKRQKPIHIAARNGDLETLKILLQTNPALIEEKDKYNQTPLIYAAAYGRIDCVNFLISKKANLNVQTSVHFNDNMQNEDQEYYKYNNAKTPLHWAVCSNHSEIVTSLIRAKANTEIPGSNNSNALMLAIEHGHLESVQAFFEAKPKLIENQEELNKLLAKALAKKKDNIVNYLLNLGAGQSQSFDDKQKDFIKQLIRITQQAIERLDSETSRRNTSPRLFGNYDRYKDPDFIALDNMLKVFNESFTLITQREIPWDEIKQLIAQNRKIASIVILPYFDDIEKEINFNKPEIKRRR